MCDNIINKIAHVLFLSIFSLSLSPFHQKQISAMAIETYPTKLILRTFLQVHTTGHGYLKDAFKYIQHETVCVRRCVADICSATTINFALVIAVALAEHQTGNHVARLFVQSNYKSKQSEREPGHFIGHIAVGSAWRLSISCETCHFAHYTQVQSDVVVGGGGQWRIISWIWIEIYFDFVAPNIRENACNWRMYHPNFLASRLGARCRGSATFTLHRVALTKCLWLIIRCCRLSMACGINCKCYEWCWCSLCVCSACSVQLLSYMTH